MNWFFLTIIIQLIFLECILSIDNAAVMGAMVAHLPDDRPTPWPARLQGAFGWADRLLGSQREAALKVGLFGAYAGRILMLALASAIVDLGAANDERTAIRQRGFWAVVLALNLVDMAFSLDNVVAAVALSNNLWIVVLGVGIGIAIIRFGAAIFTRLIVWEPALEHAAYLLLLAIGGELLLELWLGLRIDDLAKFAISMGILALTVLVARTRAWYATSRSREVEHDIR